MSIEDQAPTLSVGDDAEGFLDDLAAHVADVLRSGMEAEEADAFAVKLIERRYCSMGGRAIYVPLGRRQRVKEVHEKIRNEHRLRPERRTIIDLMKQFRLSEQQIYRIIREGRSRRAAGKP